LIRGESESDARRARPLRLPSALVIAAAVPILLRADDEEFDPDTVTPGIWGFVLTFLVMLVVVLLILDMVRRIRRVNYRAEVRAQLETERLEAEFAADGDAPVTDAPGTGPRGEPGSGPEPDAAASDDDQAPPKA
jgi:hypothetical protein